jgi:hypothetical protein
VPHPSSLGVRFFDLSVAQSLLTLRVPHSERILRRVGSFYPPPHPLSASAEIRVSCGLEPKDPSFFCLGLYPNLHPFNSVPSTTAHA